MRIEEAAIAEDALEGRRLQSLLGFREHYVASTVAAQVIGTSGSEQSRVLTIDKGWRDGLKPDMAVITPDGIVGKLRDVFPTTSQVLEINDQSSGAGVIFESTRIRAILRGTVTGRIQIGNLTADSRIKVGETVLTSGGDQVYPRGLPVGTIESIAPDPDHQPYSAIVVRPAVNLFSRRRGYWSSHQYSGRSAGRDAAGPCGRGCATCRPTLAPSGCRDFMTTRSQEPTGNPPRRRSRWPPGRPPAVVLPRPLPTVHADRFTTGATPPAADLTRGAPNPAPPAVIPASPREGAPRPTLVKPAPDSSAPASPPPQ